MTALSSIIVAPSRIQEAVACASSSTSHSVIEANIKIWLVHSSKECKSDGVRRWTE